MILTIRNANKNDTEAMWNIFHEVVKTGDTYTFSPDITKDEALSYWMGKDKHTYVAEGEQGIFATYIIKDNQPALGSHIANASFMVSPNAQGKSIGKKMGEHALATAKQLGYQAMQFNIVISTNEAAIALWKKLGFEIIGTIPDAFSHQKLNKFVDAHIMYRKL